MGRPSSYKTRQSEAILLYIASLSGTHVTAAQITAHFEGAGEAIALTTVYRHLDRLVGEGKIRRYIIDGISGASYQYIDETENRKEYFYLKCEDCGGLTHLQCNEVNAFRQHIIEAHDFQINAVKTVFYGKCKDCFKAG